MVVFTTAKLATDQVLESFMSVIAIDKHQYGGGSRSPRWRKVVNPVRSGRKQP